MNNKTKIYSNIKEMENSVQSLLGKLKNDNNVSGLCGFDGFIDSLISMEKPGTMSDFSKMIKNSAGIAASYFVKQKGEQFGGNGPLFVNSLYNLFEGRANLTYAGAIGEHHIHPLFKSALENRIKNIFPLAYPSKTECLEFSDGKIMLNDLDSCDKVTWNRLLDVMGSETLDTILKEAQFIGALNWGKLPHATAIWENISERIKSLSINKKKIRFFMDLAEFEQRSKKEIKELLITVKKITEQCHSMLSFNLKEAWDMAEYFGKNYKGDKEPESLCSLVSFLQVNIEVDALIIHPNECAIASDSESVFYIPGPFCKKPLISTGAGDNFGAGFLAASLLGCSIIESLIMAVSTSGYFVRSGISPSMTQISEFLSLWSNGTLGERL